MTLTLAILLVVVLGCFAAGLALSTRDERRPRLNRDDDR